MYIWIAQYSHLVYEWPWWSHFTLLHFCFNVFFLNVGWQWTWLFFFSFNRIFFFYLKSREVVLGGFSWKMWKIRFMFFWPLKTGSIYDYQALQSLWWSFQFFTVQIFFPIFPHNNNFCFLEKLLVWGIKKVFCGCLRENPEGKCSVVLIVRPLNTNALTLE